ncbi:hypothetical protein B0J18DRAFT_431754 [Chaetomium sp. MPI-SDFR-AT-0129]|nr:hypothetical protein B0J18DRAFT_431754 [Chaetomium sp. MPI-SDFR-AT-0129]
MDEERTITLDLGSSPDPLIDPILSPPMVPPSTVKKKSQAAGRLFTALAPSPRKQTFELDVGNERTPQRLRVTVEAEDEATRNTSRRLFQSPTPKQRRLTPRRETIVTTSVPLRGLSDDEGGASATATPRRRGRPRKSGTPATTTRKRPGTPAKAGRKSGERVSVSPAKDVPTSDIGTPRSGAQAKGTKRKATSPAKGDGAPASQPRKRGRPRKQTNTADEIARLGEESPSKSTDRNGDSFVALPIQPQPANKDVEEDDIWLATMSDQPTPTISKQSHSYLPDPESELARDESDYPEYGWADMGGGADSHSEGGSLASEQGDEPGDNTMMAEEFTMISIGSLPSMQPNSSVMAPAHEDLGDETSLIINGALESLRQSQNRPVEEELPGEPTPRAAKTRHDLVESPRGNHIQLRQEQEQEQLQLPPPSPSSRTLRRSPRRTTAQPLARKLAEKSLQQASRESLVPAPEPEPEPELAPSPHQPPTYRPQETDTEQHDTSTAYDDSFSDIPEEILIAATPRRFRKKIQREEQPVEDEPVQAAVEDIQPSIERPSRVNHTDPHSETKRMLTPDETPSPLPVAPEAHGPDPNPDLEPDLEPELHPPQLTSLSAADLPSSPPIEQRSPSFPTQATAAQHIRRHSTETPAERLSGSFTSSRNTKNSSGSGSGSRDARLSSGQGTARHLHLTVPEPEQRRPTLSPIVRAGRALQLITSDPPSPPERDSMLGSPFRGSVPPKLSPSPAAPGSTVGSGAAAPPMSQTRPHYSQPQAQPLSQEQASPSSRKSWLSGPLSQMRNFIVRSAQSLSPTRVSVSGAERMDDPFGPDAIEPGSQRERSASRGSDSVRKTLFSGSSARRSHERDAGVAITAGSPPVRGTAAVRDEDEMSWQEEGGSPAGESQRLASPDLGGDGAGGRGVPNNARLHGSLIREAPPRQHELERLAAGADFDQPMNGWEEVVEEEEHQEEHAQEEEDDDIWAIEAQRPTPHKPRHALAKRDIPNNPLQIAPAQNSWGEDNQRRNYSEGVEEEHLGSGAVRRDKTFGQPTTSVQTRREQVPVRFSSPDEDEEFSMLSQNRLRRAPTPAKPLPPNKPDLSNFFSSPALLPGIGDQAPGGGVSRAPAVPRVGESNSTVPKPRTLASQRSQSNGNGLFAQYKEPRSRSQSPHKQLEIGLRHRSVDLFSPVRKSVERSSPEPSSAAAPARPVLQASSPASPLDEENLGHIPQKLNFTPRRREARDNTNNALFQPKPVGAPSNSLFGNRNTQISAFFSQSRSGRPQPGRQQEREDEYYEEQDDQESAFVAPTLKALPDRAVPPGKSSIRSPLKPKTPGRVVEFTSSTLSPLTQAQSRAAQRSGLSLEKEMGTETGDGKGKQQELGQSQGWGLGWGVNGSLGDRRGEADKENRASSSSASPVLSLSRSLSLSPSPSPSPSPKPHRRPLSSSLLSSSSTSTGTTTTIPSLTNHAPTSVVNATPTSSTAANKQNTTRHSQPHHQQHPQQPDHPPPTTKWTRTHWLRLDELLQARKRGIHQLNLELANPESNSNPYSTRPPPSQLSGRESQALRLSLLGKLVSAQGERMAIEGWHLDVVEGFLNEMRRSGGVVDKRSSTSLGSLSRSRSGSGSASGSGSLERFGDRWGLDDGDDPGDEALRGERRDSDHSGLWDGAQIAKRVFALLVGEERRRLGLVPVRDWHEREL